MSTRENSTTLADLAARFGLELSGDGARPISGVATLHEAGAQQISFLANPRYRKALAETRAAAVILSADEASNCPVPCLVSARPYADFARVGRLFEQHPHTPPGVHASAVISPAATVDASAHVGAHVCIGARSVVGARAVIGAGCVIGEDCTVGAGCVLVARVTLVIRVVLGERVTVHPGAVLGAEGFGNVLEQGAWIKVPQLGGVRIGDDCEIGANTCIDRGALGDTVLEEDVRLDNLIQIAHNVHVGAHTAMAACVGIAGSTRIGRNCLIAGQAGVGGHLDICDNVVLTAASALTHSISEPGTYSGGLPVTGNATWRRNAARFARLDATLRRLLRGARGSDPSET